MLSWVDDVQQMSTCPARNGINDYTKLLHDWKVHQKYDPVRAFDITDELNIF